MALETDGTLSGLDSRSFSPSPSTAPSFRPSVINQLNESPLRDRMARLTANGTHDGFASVVSSSHDDD